MTIAKPSENPHSVVMTGNEKTSRGPGELASEADAYAFLERLRWGNDGPTTCPHCGSDKGAWYLKPKDPGGRKSKGGSSARSQRRVWKCRENACRRQFSVLTNTVLHATKMPVRAWVGTVVDLCRDPAGVSARDVASRWNVTEKSAWTMLTRIEEALADTPVGEPGTEADRPVWFELGSAQREQVEQAREHRNQAAAQALEARMRAEEQAVEGVDQDAGQALVDAETPSPTGGDAPASPSFSPPNSDHETPAPRPIPAFREPAGRNKSGSVTDRSGPSEKGMSDAETHGRTAVPAAATTSAIAPEKSPYPVPDQSADELPAKVAAKVAGHGSQVSDQVKSDVERALAEAFGQPVDPTKKAQKQAAETLSGDRNDRAERDSRRSRGASEQGAEEPPRRPKRTQDVDSRPTQNAAEHGDVTSKRRRKKRSNAPRSEALPGASGSPQGATKPVDNASGPQLAGRNPAPERGRPNRDDAATPPTQSRAEQRRSQQPRVDRDTASTAGADSSLGGGWLRATDAEPTNVVSKDQGKLRGIEAPELGPAWASNPSTTDDETAVSSDTFANQLGLFADDTTATQSD